MDIQTELQHTESLLFGQITSAASHHDVAGIAALSALAKECEMLKTDLTSLIRRVEAVKSALNGSGASSTSTQKFTPSAEAPALSGKAAGVQARNAWIAWLKDGGIYLRRHGKQYQTVQGQSVAVAFANELPKKENRWFLGLPDEPTDIVVLLCKSLAGQFHEIVLPVSYVRKVWHLLSRGEYGLKLHIRKDAGRFFQLVAGNELDVTKHVANYEPLR